MEDESEKITVKVQWPICSSTNECLIYDESREFITMIPCDDIKEQMKGREKVFFNVRIDGNMITIIKEIEGQDW